MRFRIVSRYIQEIFFLFSAIGMIQKKFLESVCGGSETVRETIREADHLLQHSIKLVQRVELFQSLAFRWLKSSLKL
jgi:hypothetical protein